MGSPYSSRVSRPIGCSDKAMGGAALNMGLEAIMGETDMITVFDDFNGVVLTDEFDEAANWETNNWVLTEDADVASVGAVVCMNDPNEATNIYNYDSCITIYPGTSDDSGGNMQLDVVNGGVAAAVTQHQFPHIWVPASTVLGPQGVAADALDHSVLTFATRIGFRADRVVDGAGAWDGKAYIGWAAAGDTSILDHDTGVITTAAGNLHGFHICELAEINGVSKRATADAIVDPTNETEIYPITSADGTVANGAAVAGDTMWFDLALRMDITNMSDDDANGWTTFYHRGPLNKNASTVPGGLVSPAPGEGYMPWTKHDVVIPNQTPNHTVTLVPTIEVINGPTAGVDCVVYVDWWAFGKSRTSMR